MERFDAIVVGAGPAGSTTAYRLAEGGASVLLLDRARFPRDKPCGGGLTGRALRLLPFSVDPVVEDATNTFEIRLRYRGGFVRRSEEPLAVMTQRSRLDAYLAEQAAAMGADFRDRTRVDSVEAGPPGVAVRAGGRVIRGGVLIGADGANGVTARALGLAREIEHGVALEGNVPHGVAPRERYAGRIVIELGVVPGGYGWVFPKGDHVNVGVGGWRTAGPGLREALRRLCAEHKLPWERVESLRGHRLPLRRAPTPLAHGRALVVGDAAGLVDPVSGDGMYEAFLSGKLASEVALDLIAGGRSGLDAYDDELRRALARLLSVSWGIKIALDRFPRLSFALVRLPLVWRLTQAVMHGDFAKAGIQGSGDFPIGRLERRARARASEPP